MDGGYYKAFQKALSRPIRSIFNKIFSHPTKQSGPRSVRNRSIHSWRERISPHCQGLSPAATETWKIHEPRGLQPIQPRLPQAAKAFGKELAMTAIKILSKSPETPLRTLRQIDAAGDLQALMCDEV